MAKAYPSAPVIPSEKVSVNRPTPSSTTPKIVSVSVSGAVGIIFSPT